MLEAIIIALIVGLIVGLGCVLLGRVLKSIGVPPAEAVGGFFEQFAWAIGIVAALWFFFAGGSIFGLHR